MLLLINRIEHLDNAVTQTYHRKIIKHLPSLLLFGGLFCCSNSFATSNTEKAGDALELLIPAVGLGATLLYEDGYDGSMQFGEAFVAAQLTTEALKILVHKRRPNGDCCKSFPSGHTTTAFMGAGFIHRRYGWRYAIPAYVAASYVGYSRVQSDKHYVSDVVAGAAIGLLSSFYFVEPYKGMVITPSADNGSYGIKVMATW